MKSLQTNLAAISSLFLCAIITFAKFSDSLELSSMRRHYIYQAKQNHPATYEESPDFKGPLVLKQGITTSDNRCRIQDYYYYIQNLQSKNNNNNDDGSSSSSNDQHTMLVLPKEQIRPLKQTDCTDRILKSIIDHLAYNNAPVDVKEVAESIEFFLRTRKRLMGAAKKFHLKCDRQKKQLLGSGSGSDVGDGNASFCKETKDDSNTFTAKRSIHVYDLCSGHGLTGILFAACNPPNKDRIVKTILVDQTEPPSFQILSGLIGQICPWLDDVIEFQSISLEEFQQQQQQQDDENLNSSNQEKDKEDIAKLVIATHACGSLTDKVLEIAVNINACGIAAMPCCYTGTDKGTPYGIKRALGVSWSADIRRCFFLNDNNYHSDLATIPKEITPMNRIIVAEDRS